MPEKTTKQGRKYAIDGRKLVWHPEDDEGEQGNAADILIPLRIKMGLVIDVGTEDFDAKTMVAILDSLIPDRMDDIREMDANDFNDMFLTWQTEYEALSGAKLGESGASVS